MNVKRISKYIIFNKNIVALALIISLIICTYNYSDFGVKELLMIFIATNLLVYMIYLITKDVKNSLYLFILCLPILVTARRVCYLDFLFMKVTYESIYITSLFILKFKEIKNYYRKYYLENKFSNFMVLIILLSIFSLNSIIFSSDIIMSLRYVCLGVFIPIMFMVEIKVFFSKSDVIKVYYLLILNINFSCLYGFFQIISDGFEFEVIKANRAFITFGYHNVNIFAGILLLIIPLVLDLILYKQNSVRIKIFLYISLFIQMFALWISYTRGAWITFLICIFIMLISKRFRKILIIYSASMLVVIKPLFSYIISRGYGAITILSNQSATSRIQGIFTSFKIMLTFPFGIGMGNYQEVYRNFVLDGYMIIPKKIRWNMNAATYTLEHAHNLFLQIGVELGIVTLIVFILMVVNRIIIASKNYSINRGMIAGIILYMIYSLITGNEFNHKGVITGTLILYIYFSLIQINFEKQ